MPRFVLTLLLGLLVVGAPARGQDVVLELTGLEVGGPGEAEEGEPEDGGDGKYLHVGIRTNLPRDSGIDFRLHFEGRPISELWESGYLEDDGSDLTLVLGPLEKELLPGQYEVLLYVDPTEQNPERQEFWSRFSGQIERRFQQQLGSPDAEQTARAQHRSRILTWVDRIEGMRQQVKAYGDEWLEQKRFRDGGKFQVEEFMTWANSIHSMLTEFDRFHVAPQENVYVPYYASAYIDIMPQIWVNGSVYSINYTIYPILQKEGIDAPEHLQPLKVPMLPPKPAVFFLIEQDLDRVRRVVGEGELPPLASYVPGEDDLPEGFEIGPVPPDLVGILDENPTHFDPVDARARDRLRGVATDVDIPTEIKSSALVFCLTSVHDSAAQDPQAEPASRVLAVVVRIPDLPMLTEIPGSLGGEEEPALTRPESLLSAKGTSIVLVAREDVESMRALGQLQRWFVEEFGALLVQDGTKKN
ncbi:MAG: hypothetical protein HY720_10870 [Planctomycetes bacterium]|nr:hypothetical protein [Planctomycetota bacterium]